jgi:hypothetical protein
LQAMLDYGSLTQITPPNKSSAIDLTLSSSDLSLGRHSWTVLDVAAGSDHLSILSSLQTLEIPTKFFLPIFDLTRHISWSAFADTVLESLPRITDEMSLCGAYAISMEIVSDADISAQTRTPRGYRGPGVQKAVWWDTECDRASKQKLLENFVTQVARRVIRLTLIKKRTYRIYANGKRRKRRRYCSPLTYETRLLDISKMARKFRNFRSQIPAPHDPDAWLPAFASKTAPDFAPNEFSVPYLASKRFLYLA